MLHSTPSFRPIATGFAVLLGLFSIWILAAEATRPSVGFFPANATGATALAIEDSSAGRAAWLGWPRGDLWTDHALTANAGVIAAAFNNSAPRADNAARDIAETAAVLSPSDARPWLLLAAATPQTTDSAKTIALLKMSYYTSPYSDVLFPMRIQVATRASYLTDEELGGFAEYELGVALSQRPDLKQSIALAYRAASPDGRRFFDRALAKLDPAFLSQLSFVRR